VCKMFDKLWFKKHQKTLLWFANSWIGRKVLCIDGDKSSVGKHKITGITPNSIKWNAGRYKKIEFRTHEKFGKRLFYAFKPVWALLHALDTLVINKIEPAYNLGFDTYGPVYPEASSGGTGCDGHMYTALGAESWATTRAGGGDGVSVIAATTWGVVGYEAASTENLWGSLRKSGYTMTVTRGAEDLPEGATISAAVFSIYGYSKDDLTSSTPDINVYSFAPATANSIVAGDFDSLGTTAYSSTIAYADWNTSAYNNFTLNSTGISAIPSSTGYFKIGARNANHDVANSAPNWVSGQYSGLGGYFSDQAGTDNDPKLVVTYTEAVAESGTNSRITLLGVGI